MTLQEGLDYCNIVLAKDQNGNTLNPVQYNVLLKAVNDELFEDKYLDFVKNKTLPFDLQYRMLNASPIKKFVTNATISRVAGKFNMPADARYPAAVIATVDGVMRNVEMVDEAGFAMLKTSVLHRDVSKNPIGVQREREWVFIPTLNDIEVAYFRNPATPYYDYAVDSADNIVYLPATDYQLVETATPDYYDVYYNNGIASILMYSNVYYDKAESGGIGTSVYPLTVELEWEQQSHMVFFNKILERMGINIRDTEVGKYTQLKDAQTRIN